jgi:ribosomal protein S3
MPQKSKRLLNAKSIEIRLHGRCVIQYKMHDVVKDVIVSRSQGINIACSETIRGRDPVLMLVMVA